ncbi:MAG: hypothetical protein Q8O46_01540, partial [bacterium]|nr:hypothetical protein [bacterium]
MYDKKHRFMEISLNPCKKIQLRQKGLREELLCNNCEQKIGKYEKYVSEFIYGGKCKGILQGNAIYLKGLDYKKVRICYLSILWRMSIASCNVFRSVSLGVHEQGIKNIILSDNPGQSEKYGFMCFAPLINGKFYSDLILQPVRGKIGGH